MTALSQVSLEQAIADIAKYQQETGESIRLKPTKFIMVKYLDETMQEWQDRCQRARETVARLGAEKEKSK